MDHICVYCGSSKGRKPAYAKAARAFGRTLAARGICLVYGGGAVGMMGELADAVLAAGGKAHGVIPEALQERELSHEGLTALDVVDSMHARKARMAELADGFVALPGGFGTLEELLEVLTWAQLGFHRNPCGLLNIDGYFDQLVAFLDHQTAQGFVRDEHRDLLVVAADAGELLDAFIAYDPPDVEKVITDEEET